VAVGEIIQFGGYDWRVLDVRDGKALIITDKVIESRPYNDEWYITWADCDLREYLNGSFYNSFNATNKNWISETRNVNKDNQWHGTSGGADTTDNIFLLSLEEVVKYFGDSGQLANGDPNNDWFIDDQYNSARVAYTAKRVRIVYTAKGYPDYLITRPAGTAWGWWLRSPGGWGYGYAACVSHIGRVFVDGCRVDHSDNGLRPALRLNL
jgi:hypothetical protein